MRIYETGEKEGNFYMENDYFNPNIIQIKIKKLRNI